MEVRELWVQERVRREELSIIKVRGEDNVADGLTKRIELSKMEMCLQRYGFLLTRRAALSWRCVSLSSGSIGSTCFPLLQPWHVHELQRFNLPPGGTGTWGQAPFPGGTKFPQWAAASVPGRVPGGGIAGRGRKNWSTGARRWVLFAGSGWGGPLS